MRKNHFCKVDEETNQRCVELFNQGISITKIAKEYGLDRACLSKRLKARGCNVQQHCNRKHTINHNYFHNIDNENKAYWLGFWYADGYLSSRDKSLEISLKENDANHLQKFLNDISSDYPIKTRSVLLDGKTYKSCRLCFHDAVMHKDLTYHGCTPKKSFTIHLPKLDDNLMRHFIRGYFDGDGSISKNERLNKCHVDFSSGCENFLIELKEYLNKTLGLNFKIIWGHTCYSLYLSSIKDKLIFLTYLYDNANVYLDRKFEKSNYCRFEAKVAKRFESIRAELSGKTVTE